MVTHNTPINDQKTQIPDLNSAQLPSSNLHLETANLSGGPGGLQFLLNNTLLNSLITNGSKIRFTTKLRKTPSIHVEGKKDIITHTTGVMVFPGNLDQQQKTGIRTVTIESLTTTRPDSEEKTTEYHLKIFGPKTLGVFRRKPLADSLCRSQESLSATLSEHLKPVNDILARHTAEKKILELEDIKKRIGPIQPPNKLKIRLT